MIQIGFCDDDLSILSELRVLLDRYRVERNVEIASAAFQSPLELLTEIERGTRFDILLLDVMMPGENELRDTLPLLASGSEILWVCGEGFADGLAPDTESRWILHLDAEIETQEEKTNEYAR